MNSDPVNYRREILYNEKSIYSKKQNRELDNVIYRLIREANIALSREYPSVTKKPRAPASEDIHDYFSVAPYHWYDSESTTANKHIWKDGQRIPESRLFSPRSARFDRSQLQRLFDDSTVLSLALFITGREEYGKHSRNMIRNFFLNPATRMNPNLNFAQTLIGAGGSNGRWQGLIDLNGLHYFLDSIRILFERELLVDNDMIQLHDWFSALLTWLIDSPQGNKAASAHNNIGTYYDLTVASVSELIGDHSTRKQSLDRAYARISDQFSISGEQPQETARTLSNHYTFFSIHAWIGIIRLHSRNSDLTGAQGQAMAEAIRGAASWAIAQQRVSPTDLVSNRPQAAVVAADLGIASYGEINRYAEIPYLDRYSGVRPFWNLGLDELRIGL